MHGNSELYGQRLQKALPHPISPVFIAAAPVGVLETDKKPLNLPQICPFGLSEPLLLCISDIPALPILCKLSLKPDLFDFQRHDRYTTLYAYEPTYLDGDSDILYEKSYQICAKRQTFIFRCGCLRPWRL